MGDREWCPTMPSWVRRIRVGKGHDLTVMARSILEGLWFCAPVERGGEMFTGPVDLGRWTPSIPELAEANGIGEASAGKALRLVFSVGWATRKGRSIVLSWRQPRQFGGLDTRSSGAVRSAPECGSVPEDPLPEDRSPTTRVRSTPDPGKVESAPEDRSHLTTPLPLLTKLPRGDSPEQASFALEVQEAQPRDLVGELRAIHERLIIDACAIHGLKSSVPGRKRGTLPPRGSKGAKSLDARIEAAIAQWGFDACVAFVEWKSGEWRAKASDAKRPPAQMWSPGTLGFVSGKLERGVDWRGHSLEPSSPTDDLPPYTPDPDDHFAGMQAHEIERELM